MSMFNIITAKFASLRSKWATNPGMRGSTKMVLGAALLAEGLFGIARGPRNGTSLFGSIMLTLGAVVFLWVGNWILPESFADAVQVQGEVSQLGQMRDSDGKRAYQPVYSYVVDGKTYTITSALTTGGRPTLGSTVEIIYSAAEPRNAYRKDGMDGYFPWIFIGSGVILALWAATSLIISLILIVVGLRLFLSGRKDRQANEAENPDASAGFFQDLIALVTEARKQPDP